MKKVKKYLPGAESLGTSFSDKAGAAMGNYGGMITQAAGSLMPLLMKKPDPNAKPYKKGSKLIKYQDGSENIQTSKLGKKAFDQINAEPKVAETKTVAPTTPVKDATFEDNKNLLPEDLLSKKDRMISKLPKFIQKTLAGKAKGRIDAFQKDYDSAKSNLFLNGDLSILDENRIARKIVSNRKNKTTSESNYTPEEYPDTFEKSKGKMGSAITFGDEYGPGKKEYVKQLIADKKKNLQARLDGEEAREKYEADMEFVKNNPYASWSPNNPDYSKPSTSTTNTNIKDIVAANTSNAAANAAATKQSNPYIAFKNMSAADQKLYRAGMAKGEDFEVDGRKYKAAVPKQRMHSDRMQRLYEKNPTMYNKLITKTSKFKEGTKKVKVENPKKILKGKNGAPDTLYNKNTGRKIAFISGDDDTEKVEKKVVKKQTVVKTENKTTTPKPTETKENKGLYQGNKTAEALVTGAAPAVAELAKSNPTSGVGKTVKSLIKYGPAVGRFVYDAIADKKNKGSIDWKARTGKFMQDITVGTATSGAVKTARGARKNYKEQESAAAKETENPIAPSRKEALKVGANEAVDKATVTKLPKKVISYVKDVAGNSPQGKQAALNVKNANAHKAATNPDAKVKFSGKGDGAMGKEGQYYREGKPVSEKEYNAAALSDQKQKVGKKIKSLKVSSKEVGNIRFKKKSREYTDELEKRSQLEKENYISPGSNIQGPNLPKTNPVKTEAAIRRRTGEEIARQKEKGFADKEGRTASEFKNYYIQEKNRIETQPRPSNMSDEDFAKKKTAELESHKQTMVAYNKSVAENKATIAEKNKPKIESKSETPETTVKPKKERASRGGATQENPNALTEQARVTETTETTKKKKTQSASTEESNTGKDSSGPTDGPTMNASELGIVGKKKRGSQKANGARLIKYK